MYKSSLPVLALLTLIAGAFSAVPAQAGCQAICVKTGPFCWACDDAGEETGAWCTEPGHCFCMLQQCFAGGSGDQAAPRMQLFAGPSELGLPMDLTAAATSVSPSCGEARVDDSVPEITVDEDEPEVERVSQSD